MNWAQRENGKRRESGRMSERERYQRYKNSTWQISKYFKQPTLKYQEPLKSLDSLILFCEILLGLLRILQLLLLVILFLLHLLMSRILHSEWLMAACSDEGFLPRVVLLVLMLSGQSVLSSEAAESWRTLLLAIRVVRLAKRKPISKNWNKKYLILIYAYDKGNYDLPELTYSPCQ